MPKEKLLNLITRLHDSFGDEEVSPQQQQLLDDMKLHIHNINEPAPTDPDMLQTIETLIEDIEEDHPKAAGLARDIMEILVNIGI
ncbi:MAG: DUF4404 family protein [Pseudomonadales bacterium]|nr:DUF4404 family protein [Pseudomonadales bacterium]